MDEKYTKIHICIRDINISLQSERRRDSMSNILVAFEKFPTIRMERYRLRPINKKDCKDIFEIYSDIENIKYQGMKPLNTTYEADQYIDKIINGFNNKIFIRWCIEEQESNKVVGLIALHHIDLVNSKAQLGYILNKRYWKKGIMYSCLKEIINYLINELQIYRIEAMIHPENIPSINLAERIGFCKEKKLIKYAFNEMTNEYEGRLLYALRYIL